MTAAQTALQAIADAIEEADVTAFPAALLAEALREIDRRLGPEYVSAYSERTWGYVTVEHATLVDKLDFESSMVPIIDCLNDDDQWNYAPMEERVAIMHALSAIAMDQP